MTTQVVQPPEGAKMRRDLMSRLEPLVSEPGDGEEARHRKAQAVIASVIVVPAGLLWGALYLAFNERVAGALPLSYSVAVFANLLFFARKRRYDVFRVSTQLLFLALPFGLHITLGGFVGSSMVVVWSFLTVLMALLFGSRREAIGWFAAFVAEVVAAAWIAPGLTITNQLPRGIVLLFFILNVSAVAGVSFVVLYSFITDRRKLRELEVAYLNQEMMLRQSEKLATLGTLAAGVAHELNNPASAARRAAEQLHSAVSQLEAAHLRLGEVEMTQGGRDALRQLEMRASERDGGPVALDPLSRSDAESEMEVWLEKNGVADAWEIAPALVSQRLDSTALQPLADAIRGDALAAALTWVARAQNAHVLLREIGESSTRVSEIVGALKDYSYLGQSSLQSVDLHKGIDSTLLMMATRLGDGVVIRRQYGENVPSLQAYGSELNQVWTNLLGNAVDAMNGNGEITIRTRREGDWVAVEIEDTGPGIPAEIRPRIFDPFFTTKAPGKGVGLGLSVVHSIVTQKHGGEVRVECAVGRTRFTVSVPIEARRVGTVAADVA